MSWLLEPFQYQFMQRGLLAVVLIGVACALVGVYVVLRRMAFIGDALSHTVLPGLVVAYLNQWNLFAGALLAGVLTARSADQRVADHSRGRRGAAHA